MYHILVVDDEEMIRALIRKYAEFEGHTVTENQRWYGSSADLPSARQ